jgi:hypothetical protein
VSKQGGNVAELRNSNLPNLPTKPNGTKPNGTNAQSLPQPTGGPSVATILIPIPRADFHPTETGVPWRTLRQRGHHIVFATPNGGMGHADLRMVTGEGLGVLAAPRRVV